MLVPLHQGQVLLLCRSHSQHSLCTALSFVLQFSTDLLHCQHLSFLYPHPAQRCYLLILLSCFMPEMETSFFGVTFEEHLWFKVGAQIFCSLDVSPCWPLFVRCSGFRSFSGLPSWLFSQLLNFLFPTYLRFLSVLQHTVALILHQHASSHLASASACPSDCSSVVKVTWA